jgi:hypothetical protein
VKEKFIHKDKKNGFVIISLDSSEPDINDIQIGLEQSDWLKNQLNKTPEYMWKIVTFNPHLLPIPPKTGRERNILLEARDLLKVLMNHKVELTLMDINMSLTPRGLRKW